MATTMVIWTVYIPKAKEKSKVIKTRDGVEVAARYFAYKVYEATDGRPKQWQVLHGMGEWGASPMTTNKA
jgi:hypothetical protein